MTSYNQLRAKHQKEVDEFPLGFCFSNQQFVEMMAKWGLTPDDKDMIVSLGMGGFLRKSDVEAFEEMMQRHDDEMKAAIEGDTNGEGFIASMFAYELSNHEYGYTGELADTLECLGITYEDLAANAILQHGLDKALERY